MPSMIALSTISMIPMLIVSEASAIGITAASASPARSSGRLVSEYPKRKASATASATVPQSENPSAVPITIPAISPIAHPVRQCSVALSATTSSSRPAVGIAWAWASWAWS
jgi:hypothetical protein